MSGYGQENAFTIACRRRIHCKYCVKTAFHGMIEPELILLGREEPMRKACWVVMLSCLLIRPAAARDIFVDNAGGDDKNNGLHAQNHGDTGQPRADDRQGPAAGPAKATASCWPSPASHIASAFPGGNPAQRPVAADAVHPRRQRGHAGRLRADTRGRLDPLPRQYLPLPPQVVDPARLVLQWAFHPSRCRCPRRPRTRRG